MLVKTHRRWLTLAALCVCGIAAPASAHPGHARELAPADSMMHYIVQPTHAVVWLALVVLAAFGLLLRNRVVRSRRLVLATVARPSRAQEY